MKVVTEWQYIVSTFHSEDMADTLIGRKSEKRFK